MGACARKEHGPAVEAHILEEATTLLLSTLDLPAILERTSGLLRLRFGDTRITVHRLPEDKPDCAEVALAADPRHPTPPPGTRFPLAGTAAGEAVRTLAPVVIDPLSGVTPKYREEKELAEYGYGSLAVFPLVFEGRALGTLDIAHPPEENLLKCCLRTAEQVARLIAIALHNSLLVEEVRRLNRLLDRENARLREELREVRRDTRYIAESPRMKDVLERVRLVAPSDTSVLIRGETGSGKEGLARMVHDFGPRFGGPFVVVNMGAIPETLIESELFGHEKGAFTGATARKEGRFQQADGGTLFLDEVGDAPLPVQVRLLRVLQDREVQTVGGRAPVKVDVRIVAATNRPLEKMVEQGSFRADLYYRLNAFPVHVPPLRERREDIRPLAEHFLARQAALMHRKPPVVSPSAWRMLESASWPGNVRELENYLQRALLLSPGPELVLPEALGTDAVQTVSRALSAAAAADEAMPGKWDDEVRALIGRALRACGGRIYGTNGAAALLGLKPTTLQGKMRKYGMEKGGETVA